MGPHKPTIVSSVGHLTQDDEDGVTVVLSMTEDGDAGGYIFIPRPMVVTVRHLIRTTLTTPI